MAKKLKLELMYEYDEQFTPEIHGHHPTEMIHADVRAMVDVRIQNIAAVIEVFVDEKDDEHFVLLGQDVIRSFNTRIYNDIDIGRVSSGEHVEWFPVFGNKNMPKYETRYLGSS